LRLVAFFAVVANLRFDFGLAIIISLFGFILKKKTDATTLRQSSLYLRIKTVRLKGNTKKWGYICYWFVDKVS